MVRDVLDRWLCVRFDEALDEDLSDAGGSSKLTAISWRISTFVTTNLRRSFLRWVPPGNFSVERWADFDSYYYVEPIPSSQSRPTRNHR